MDSVPFWGVGSRVQCFDIKVNGHGHVEFHIYGLTTVEGVPVK